jgi:uncharacterized protein YciI
MGVNLMTEVRNHEAARRIRPCQYSDSGFTATPGTTLELSYINDLWAIVAQRRSWIDARSGNLSQDDPDSVFKVRENSMYFVIFATDRAGSKEVRANERPRHHAYIGDPALPVRVRVAGPTLDADGQTRNGSLFIIEAEDMAAAEAFVADDPYGQAGLFETVVIRPFNWEMGRLDEA